VVSLVVVPLGAAPAERERQGLDAPAAQCSYS
jgi:hypothetical protein